jgi:hypothetical protein
MPADIGQMLVRLEQRLAAVEAQSRLSHASLDDAALQVKDASGGLRGILGVQIDGTAAVNIVNGGPPPVPSTPSVAPALGGIAAGWDGTFTDGAIIPLDWARVEVHASPTAGFTPTADSLVATIETAQGGIAYVPATAPQYVRLLARNTSGTASAPTSTVGPYAPRPVAGEIGIGEITATLIADGAVTTPKVFANAITTAKLSAGSVDATALKADAITGKTITGGVINGAEFHSDDGAGGLVDIQDGTVVTTADSGWQIIVDPSQTLPVIDFLSSDGTTAGSINGTGDESQPGLDISSGPFTDGAVTDWRWVTRMGQDGSTNGWRTVRVRESDVDVIKGAQLFAGPDFAQVSYVDSASPGDSTILQVQPGIVILDEARIVLDPPASTQPVIFVTAKTGHSGTLIRAQLNGADKFYVTADGAIVGSALTVGGGLAGASLALDGIDQGHGQVVFQARSSATAAVAAESVALTQTGAVLKTGRAYRIQVRGLAQNNTNGTGVRIRVRKTNVTGAVWLDSFTVTTPVANANYQYNNQQVVTNITGSTITATLVMTYASVSGGNSILNTGGGCYTTFEVTDIGDAANFSTAQTIT